MTNEQRKKLAGHIMRLLKVRSVSFPIAITDKGPFNVKYIGDADYEMVLDAVPLTTKHALDDDNNIELKAVLEKYWFEKEKTMMTLSSNNLIKTVGDPVLPKLLNVSNKKRGRPSKVKA